MNQRASSNRIKLKAFTIIEMLIVMILSAIVVGLTYMYFTQFQNYIMKVSKSDDNYQTYNQFIMVFKKDLESSEIIQTPALYELELLLTDNKIKYWFDNEFIIRNISESEDTFFLKTGELYLTEYPSHNGLVKIINFDTEMSKEKYIPFYYVKKYTSKSLFEFYEQNKP